MELPSTCLELVPPSAFPKDVYISYMVLYYVSIDISQHPLSHANLTKMLLLHHPTMTAVDHGWPTNTSQTITNNIKF